MATIVLQAAGAYLGGFLGTTAAAIGSAAGALAGYVVDRALLSGGTAREGPRLSGMQPFTAEEGAALPRVFGAARISGTLIWATRFEETSRTERSGAKGGQKTTTYSYAANAAFALCEGPIAGVRRVWADGRELDLTGIEMRIHRGTEDQQPDPLIEANQGANGAPALRGTAYVVFDGLPLESYGNRLPQLQFEVLRPTGPVARKARAVALIPGSTEYGLATTRVRERIGAGENRIANRHILHASSDIVASLDELQALCPNVEDVAIVVTWFGDDLRAGSCMIRPGVVQPGGDFSMDWTVSGLSRSQARVMSQHGGGAAYGGTPCDRSVLEAIAEVKRRGLRVTLYPFVMMDVPAGNALPNPYGGTGQPAYPWRGRITCHPAPVLAGTADKTAAARTQASAFVGSATAGQFAASEHGVIYSGPAGEFGYRRLVLHYAALAAKAGGVDAFLIGSELRGITALRDQANDFPFVEALCALAADVRAMLGPETKLTYGADWSEYFGHQPADGSGDVFFHLDALWAHPAIDAVGIDNYLPLSDWRDRDYRGGNPDGFDGPYDREGLAAMVAGGEGYDWFYASEADRAARSRTPIHDGAYGKDWVFRAKDLVGWWSNPHYSRPGGVEAATPTAWLPGMKPIWLTELGCPAVDKGPNQPNVFPDPKSSEGAVPYFSNGGRSDEAQTAYLDASLSHWESGDAANPVSPVYGGPMIDPARIWLWAWDARPHPAFPLETGAWADGASWLTGHWLNGRLEKVRLGELAEALADASAPIETAAAEGTLHGSVVAGPTSARRVLEPLLDAFGASVATDGEGLRLLALGRQAGPAFNVADPALEEDPDEVATVRTRGAAGEVPDAALVTHRDPLLDYQSGVGRAVAPGRQGLDVATLDLDVALEAGEAQAIGEDWLRRRAAERETIVFRVPAQERAVELGRIVTLAGDDNEYVVLSVEEGLMRRVTARRILREAPAPRRAMLPGRETALLLGEGPAHTLFLDLPLGPDGGAPQDQLRVASFARPWIPQRLSASPETSFHTERSLVELPAVTGVLLQAAPAGIEGRLYGGSLTVRLHGGELASVSRVQLLNGANVAAIRSTSGAWEILQFESAEEIAASTWRLAGLLRGQLGTDDALGAGTAAGADFVLLDRAVVPAGLTAAEIGLTLTWRVAPAGRAYDPDTQTLHETVGGMRALLPLSPVHPRAKTLPDGSLALSWIRRVRGDADGWGAGDLPLDQTAERYRIEIRAAESGPVLRTIEAAGPACIYAAAYLAADFPARPAPALFDIAQFGDVAGYGPARRHRIDLT